MGKQFSRLVIGAGLALAAPAWSQDEPAERGWSLEANVLAVESSEGNLPLRFDDEEGGAAVAGTYSFSKHFALQGTYYDLGDHFVTDCPAPICTAVPHEDFAAIRGLSLAAVGSWRVTPAIEIFGKLGVLGTKTDFAFNGYDETDRGALVGAGVGIWATPHWRINVQVERADFDLKSAGVGLSYRF